MPQSLDHKSESLRTARNLIETPNVDVIKAGGPSSSALLNDLRDSCIGDIAELDRRTQDAQSEISESIGVWDNQLTGLATFYSSLLARLPSASGRFLADFYTEEFVYGSNGAAVDPIYGQATLPILTSQEKLVSEDSAGNVWIPKQAQVEYSYVAGTPSEVDWRADDNARKALDQRSDTRWFRNRETSGTVWVRVKVPANLNANKFANCIILHPYPVLTYDLVSVEYRNPAGVYTSADLSYLLGWNQSLSRVQSFGNLRIWIPQSQVTELRIRLQTNAFWGFSRISVRQIEFQPTATLAVDFSSYTPGTLNRVTLFGKDPNALSFLTTSINGDLVSVALTQNTQGTSPIITGVEARK